MQFGLALFICRCDDSVFSPSRSRKSTRSPTTHVEQFCILPLERNAFLSEGGAHNRILSSRRAPSQVPTPPGHRRAGPTQRKTAPPTPPWALLSGALCPATSLLSALRPSMFLVAGERAPLTATVCDLRQQQHGYEALLADRTLRPQADIVTCAHQVTRCSTLWLSR